MKPSNILISGGAAKLNDFGIARSADDESLTQTGLVTGSPAYLAPEVASGSSATPASDVWSLGATLYHAVTGKPPYDVGDNLIGALYKIEEQIRAKKLSGQNKRLHRLTHSKPLVEQFFEWVDHQFGQQGLLPSNPLTKALAYARERKAQLQVFLDDPDVPMDTNHLERALRPIPMGRRNWLFCWTEVGAQHVGIVQSLIATCRLHSIDPYTYLVDVLQRVGQHPAARVAELTPRLWKQHFADNPLRSDLHATIA